MEIPDIDDPSDWPKEFLELKMLDGLLRCSICKEYFNKAVIVPECSHNYCSLCIRRHMTKEKSCPACHKVFDINIKPNRALDEMATHFRGVRKRLLHVVRLYLEAPDRFSAELNVNEKSQSQDEEFEKSIMFRQPKVKRINSIESKEESVNPVSSGNTGSSGNTVECPVCGLIEPESTINFHLDTCLTERSKRRHEYSPTDSDREEKRFKENVKNNSTPMYNVSRAETGKRSTDQRTTKTKETGNDLISPCYTQVMKPLPKMCFASLNDKQLKKKLKDYGLRVKGDKNTLIKRLERYHLRYNAECDAANPVSAVEIARQVTEEETNLNNLRLKREGGKGGKEQKMHSEEYSKQNNSHYRKLIQQIESRKQVNAHDHISNISCKRIKVEIDYSPSANGVLFDKEYVFDISEKSNDSQTVQRNEETPEYFQTDNQKLTSTKKRNTKIIKQSTGKKSKKKNSISDISVNRNNNKHNISTQHSKDITSFFEKKDSPSPSQIKTKISDSLPKEAEITFQPEGTTVPESDTSSSDSDEDQFDLENTIVPDSPILFHHSVNYTSPSKSKSSPSSCRSICDLHSTCIQTPTSTKKFSCSRDHQSSSVVNNQRRIVNSKTPTKPIANNQRSIVNSKTPTKPRTFNQSKTRRTLCVKDSSRNFFNANDEANNDDNKSVSEGDSDFSRELNDLVEGVYNNTKVRVHDSDSDATIVSDNEDEVVPKPPSCDFSFAERDYN